MRRQHGLSNHPLYDTWAAMMQRCYYLKAIGYRNYGGRGIRVCDRWHAVENFIADMDPKPAGMTLDRKDNDGNYEPDNCRWATWTEQARNKRTPLEPHEPAQIRWLHSLGYAHHLIAGMFQTGINTVSQVVRNTRYHDPNYTPPEPRTGGKGVTKRIFVRSKNMSKTQPLSVPGPRKYGPSGEETIQEAR
jgi:hypothetical protein